MMPFEPVLILGQSFPATRGDQSKGQRYSVKSHLSFKKKRKRLHMSKMVIEPSAALCCQTNDLFGLVCGY